MRKHPFEPGKLVAGLVMLGVGLAYTLDAAGKWDVRPLVLLPLAGFGLCLAGVASAMTHGMRRRGRRTAEGEAP
ncbi:hypothetical protein HUT19_23770 [Streptomyces sp. NA02950]|uniref:hypothetical protein n=1 Tax=Streptomyces sp. NA02950 TaxID=2742137 RepID=UPI0015917E52|nr:hypothetical protein [Streptomyces sp. NA02950]QKV94399.1 hypothetical protein HUT19_23770 [Streptomyces sp. NA02950]